jgi:flavoprotein
MIHVAPIDAVLTGNNLQLQRRMEDAESVSQQQLEGFEQLAGPISGAYTI